VGPRAGLDGCGNISFTGIRSPDRPARSESVYRLSYPGPRKVRITGIKTTIFKAHNLCKFHKAGVHIYLLPLSNSSYILILK
jgi:hypothetical protein